jgi:hypothetical protein
MADYTLKDFPSGAYFVVAAVIVTAGLIFAAVFPRYDYRLIEDGKAIVIYDKWSNRFQRANYDGNGNAELKGVVTPF